MAEGIKKTDDNCRFCPFLGISKLRNDKTILTYSDIKKKKKEETPGKQFKYNLGNEIFTDNPDEAMNEFANREFPEIINYKNQPHEIIFVPNDYIFGPITKQIITKEEGRKGLEEAKQEILNKHQSNLGGLEIEEFFFNKLKTTLVQNGVKNAVVITGWKVNGGQTDPSREFDFVIVSNDSKKIFHVEAKRTYFDDTKAFEQVQKGFEFFNATIPFLPNSAWKYSKSVYFHEGWDASENKPCVTCTHHILDSTTNLLAWWKLASASEDVSNLQQDDSTYLNVLKYIFHQMYQQGDCITLTDQLKLTEKYIEEISTIKTIFFWSRIQYELLEETKETKKIAFLSPFGTGKTTLLKEKALRLLQKGKKVVFIIFQNENVEKETLLMSELKRRFQGFKSKAKFFQLLSSDVVGVEKIVQTYPAAHFFFDEVFAGVDGFPTEKLNELASGMPEESYFWIACQHENLPDNQEFMKEFMVPTMNHALRYCGKNLELNTRMKSIFHETNFPSEEVNPKLYLNQGPPSLFLALKPKVHLACAVEQLAFILDKERSTTLIKIDFEKETIIAALKAAIIKDRLVFADGTSKSYKDFLDNEKILVIGPNDNTLIRGFEVSILVHFTSRISGQQIQDIYSRCKSKLIIICNEDDASKVVPSNAATNSVGIIKIHDELMPEVFEQAIKSSDKQKLVNFMKVNRDRKVPVDSTNKASQTGLMIACQHASPDIVDEFLKRQANADAIDASHWSPIHFAADRGDLEIFNKIVTYIQQRQEQNLMTKETNKGETALHLASLKGHLRVVQYLITTYQFEVDELTHDGSTSLHLASKKGHLDVVKYLVNDCGADINLEYRKYGETTPLHLASENGCVDVVKFLVNECHADANIKDDDGSTPLHLASKDGHLEVVKFLVRDCGVDVHLMDEFRMTPLHLAARLGGLDIVKFLVEECGSEVNSKNDKNGETPLHLASQWGHLDIVKYLVNQCQADINLMDKRRETPVDIGRHKEIISSFFKSLNQN